MVNKQKFLFLLPVALLCSLYALADQVAPETSQSQVAPRLLHSKLDCSHLVHSIYESVGLHYHYTTSRVLYRGTEQFQRVMTPNAGDLIAWRGHVGIVVDPSRHMFLSALHTGVKVSSYMSGYWKNRGLARFLRYTPSSENPALVACVEKTASLALAARSSR